jgi:hypothetical protein
MSRDRFDTCKQLTFHLAGAPEGNVKRTRKKEKQNEYRNVLLIVLVTGAYGPSGGIGLGAVDSSDPAPDGQDIAY